MIIFHKILNDGGSKHGLWHDDGIRVRTDRRQQNN
jgi:hypothetical protein